MEEKPIADYMSETKRKERPPQKPKEKEVFEIEKVKTKKNKNKLIPEAKQHRYSQVELLKMKLQGVRDVAKQLKLQRSIKGFHNLKKLDLINELMKHKQKSPRKKAALKK